MLSAHAQQAVHNLATSSNWNEFSEHRRKLTEMLLSQASASKTLAVVGAGNVNDLDLSELTKQFESLALIDLDLQAMQAGVARQFSASIPTNVELIEWDATGAVENFDALQACEDQTARNAVLSALLAKLAYPAVFPRKTYDVVLSACLLSQLIGMAKSSLGEAHSEFVTLVQAVRRQHLQTMYELTNPGGLAIILLDFVSSLTAPAIESAHERNLSQLAQSLIAQRNFFTGLNPVVVKKSWVELLNFSAEKSNVQLSDCWKWNLGPRVYLVTALSVKKTS
jgi:hypothetical protein